MCSQRSGAEIGAGPNLYTACKVLIVQMHIVLKWGICTDTSHIQGGVHKVRYQVIRSQTNE